jgi:hypothetical protein
MDLDIEGIDSCCEKYILFLLQIIQTGTGAHVAIYRLDMRDYFPTSKAAGA